MAVSSSDDPILQDGQVFVGLYRIGMEVGRGGFGAVYLAEELRLKRKVAIKVLHPKFAKDKKILRRFQIEAIASSRLNHPSIVQVYASGNADDGTSFIAMEYVEGKTLQAHLKSLLAQNQRLGPTKVLQVGLQVSRVLDVAHDKGIFHRDLKPHNLMLTPDDDAPGGERVKLLDFGVAKLMASTSGGEDEDEGATSTGDQLPGTYAFMAPEQFGTYKGVTGLEGRMDVYSLGVILYQALAGRMPLFNSDPAVMMGLALGKDPDPLASIDPTLPAGVVELVHRMLQKEPETRPTMAQVRDRISTLLGLSGSRPDIVTVRATAEHQALLAKFSTGEYEEGAAATGDAPMEGVQANSERPIATPSTLVKAGKSVGERSTRPQLTSGDLILSTGRSVGQQVTSPDTRAQRRSSRLVGAVLLGALGLPAVGVAVWRFVPHSSRPEQHPIAASTPPTVAPSVTEKSFGAQPPSQKSGASSASAPALTAPSPEETAPSSPVEPAHHTRECTPVKISERCISGAQLTRAQQHDLLSAVEQTQISLCAGDRISIATLPRVEIRKSSGVKRAKLEDLTLAIRGIGLSWIGDITIQCKRP